MGIFDASQISVTLIGTGGIGAITAIVLSKMGVETIALYDPDIVDDVNLPTQFFRLDDLTDFKVDAAGLAVEEFSDDTTVIANAHRVDSQTNPLELSANVIISAVDSIQSRKDIWKVAREAWFECYLDARMAAETFQLYAVSPMDMAWYTNMLNRQTDENTPDLPCTEKATIYTAAFAAGHIAHAVKEIALGRSLPHAVIHDINARRIVVP